MVKFNTPPEIVSGRRRFTELDALRGIAVISVAIYHYTIGYDYYYHLKSANKFYLNYGNFAVHLFFIISGFVIFMTLDNTKKGADFLVSRFSRLFPAYWAAIFITVIFLKLFPLPGLGNYTIKEVAVNLTMLTGFVKLRFIDGVYWTLKIELVFYFLMYVLFISKNLVRINLFCFIWLGISLISAVINIPLKRYLDSILILEYAPLFIAGINFYKIVKSQANLINHLLILLSFLVEIVNLLHVNQPSFPYNPFIAMVIVFVFYSVFYLFGYNRLSFIKLKILLFFGSISYSFYLIHDMVGQAIIYHIKKYSDAQIFYIPIAFLLTTLIASLVSFYIEKPAMKYIRDKYKKRKEQKAAELVS